MNQVFEFYKIPSESKSIYKYSPVHIAYNQGQKVIIKKTKKHLDRMLKLFQWEELLVKSGIGVVAPITYKEKQYLQHYYQSRYFFDQNQCKNSHSQNMKLHLIILPDRQPLIWHFVRLWF